MAQADEQFSGSVGVGGPIFLGNTPNQTVLQSTSGQLLVNGQAVLSDLGVTEGRLVVAAPARSALGIATPNNILAGRMPLTAYGSMSGVRFIYGAGANTDILPDNEVLIEAALEYPSGTIYPVTFGGNRFGRLDRYGLLTSDPVAADVPAGATYYARTRILAPNNSTNLVPTSGYTTLAADVTLGASSITLTDLPVDRPSPLRMRIGGSGTEVVEIIRMTTASSPYTATLRAVLVANHTAAGSVVGQGVWTNREISSDQGATASSNLSTFDIYSGTFGVAAVSGSTTLAAATNIGDTTLQVVNAATPLRGQTFTLDTAGNVETVTARTIVGVANPYTVYLTAPLTIAHASGVAFANTNSGGSVVIPVPTAVTADYTSNAPSSIVMLGDSILSGTGNYFRTLESYATIALEPTHPVLPMSKSGESAQQFAANTNGVQRRGLFGIGKWLLYAYGTNDIYGGRTLAQWQADTATICGWAKQRGLKVAMSTITPRTTSSDGWTTVANQTETLAAGAGLVRKAANAWIRAGASGLCDLVIEAADAVETSRDSGLWKADTTIGPYTIDGLHPSYTGHIRMATACLPGMFV